MHEATTTSTLTSDTPEDLSAAARRAEAWFGEPFVHPDEELEAALAPGTARRAALDDALAEIDAGRNEPSSRWKVRYGLMLGLERVLTEDTPRTATGTELRRHQVDALTGMLAELIASTQRAAEENGNGNGTANGHGGGNGASLAEAELDEEAEDDFDAGYVEELEPSFHGTDPGAARRYRFRHPTASGKTIAAAGFVEAASRLGILILTHRRLLVSQFKRDLTTRATETASPTPCSPAHGRRARTRSRSRPTPGSRGTAPTSTARRITSSSATRRTPRSGRRRAPRSEPSPTPSTSA